jgi:patatin-like phospholipase/acyl hydrolase
MIFFDINIYTFKFEEMGYNNVKTSRTFRRYLKVNPNLIQSLIDYEKSIPDGSTASAYDASQVLLGLADESAWDKRFKMRITSKHSGKKFDINFTCKVIPSRKKTN